MFSFPEMMPFTSPENLPGSSVLCFGELLLRLSPSADGLWLEENLLPAFPGGAELNVATALSLWGVPAAFCTALPNDNYLSTAFRDAMTRRGVDHSRIVSGGKRIGIYFLQQGTDLKTASVVYDRAYSAFSELKPGSVDWNRILTDVNYLHFSAITPALNDNLAAVVQEGLEIAAARGIIISIDLNYRAKLWDKDRLPHTVMPHLVKYCSVIMGNIWSTRVLLGTGLHPEPGPDTSLEEYLEQAHRTSMALQERFPRCSIVANTFRFDRPGGGIHYYATLDAEGKQYHSTPETKPDVVDRVGSGDCFMAGLLYGLYNGHGYQRIIDFAAAAAIMKTGEKGDATKQTVDSIVGSMNPSIRPQ